MNRLLVSGVQDSPLELLKLKRSFAEYLYVANQQIKELFLENQILAFFYIKVQTSA